MLFIAVLFLAVTPPESAAAWDQIKLKPTAKVVAVLGNGRVVRGAFGELTSGTLAFEDVSVLRAAGAAGSFHTVYAPWHNVAGIPRGHKIRIVRKNLLFTDGAYFSSDDTQIVVTSLGQQIRIARNEIRKVRIRIGNRSEDAAKVGAATGAVAVLAVVFAAALHGGSADGAEGLLELVTGGTAAAGEAIGALFDEFQTIYLAPRP